MRDIKYLFKLKGIVEDRYEPFIERLCRLEQEIIKKLYPTEYDNERKYTVAFIRLMNKLMVDHGITEEQAYTYLDRFRNDPDQCDLGAAIEELERHAKIFEKEDL